MPTINIGFTAGGLRLQAGRGLFSVESAGSTFAKTGALGYTITVTPANPSIASGTEQFTATANYTNGTQQNVTTTATWTSSNTSVATISNTSGTQGLATSTSSGFTTITATLGTVSGNTTLSVGNLSIKFNPGHYVLSDVRDYHGGFSPSQRQTEMNVLATTGTGGHWAGSPFLGYSPCYSWSFLETSLGVYNFASITNDFIYLQSVCPGARFIPQIFYSESVGNLPVTATPPIPSYILSSSSTYGAGPPGGSGSGYGLSGWNGTSGVGAAWQISSAAVWRPAVMNRYIALLQALAVAVIPDGSGLTFNTHPLIEAVYDPDENSWNFFYGPAAPSDYSSSAMNTQLQAEMTAAVAAFTQTSFGIYQSFGNDPTFPDPNLPGLIAFSSSNRQALTNSDVFGKGMAGTPGSFGISAQEIYVGNVYNYGTNTWGTGGTDYRGTMCYQANIQAPDYFTETPASTPAQAVSDIYATCQKLHITHIIWNISDDNQWGLNIGNGWLNAYVTPFVKTNPVPNTTYPLNYPTLPRLTSVSNFNYLGAFSLPGNFDYGGTALAIGPNAASPPSGCSSITLFVANQPASIYSSMGCAYVPTDSNINNTASFVAPSNYIDPPPLSATDGIVNQINTHSTQTAVGAGPGLSSAVLGGAYYDTGNNRLILGYYWYFPAGGYNTGLSATYNAVSINPQLQLSSLQLNLQIGNTFDGCNYGSCIGPIDSVWQAEMGATHISTQGTLPINGARQCRGPVLTCFNLPALSSGTTLPAKTIAWYGNADQSNLWIDSFIYGFTPAGGWDYGLTGGQAAFNALPLNNYWSDVTDSGVAFVPSGYRTLVVYSVHGAGTFVYGEATTNPAMAGQVAQTGLFTGSVTSGIAQITGVSLTSGSIPTNYFVTALDSQGFYAQLPGLSVSTQILGYNSSSGVITLSASPTVNGSFTFAAADGAALGYELNSGFNNKTTHAYPYYTWMEFYDMNDVLASLAGGSQQPLPYYAAELPVPAPTTRGQSRLGFSGTACYDPNTGNKYGDGSKGRMYATIAGLGAEQTVKIGVWALI